MARVLQVPAVIDITETDKSIWGARGLAEPFEGIFSVGTSFAEARKAFAEVVALGVTTGGIKVDGLDPAELASVRVLATTRKTFTLDELDTGDGA